MHAFCIVSVHYVSQASSIAMRVCKFLIACTIYEIYYSVLVSVMRSISVYFQYRSRQFIQQSISTDCTRGLVVE